MQASLEAKKTENETTEIADQTKIEEIASDDNAMDADIKIEGM